MQTPQVSNPANLLTSPAPAGKQSDADSAAAPFGQVLSREIAGRSANEGGKTQAREAGNGAAARQAARHDGKTAEAKAGKEAKQLKQQDDKAVDGSDSMDAAMQASEDMLALVANLTQIVPQAESADTAVGTESAADAAATVITVGTTASAETLAVAQGVTAADPAAVGKTAPVAAPLAVTIPTIDTAAPVVQLAPGATPAAAAIIAPTTTIAVGAGLQAQVEPGTAARSETSHSVMPDFAAKGRELLTGAAISGGASRAPEQLRGQEPINGNPILASGAVPPHADGQEFSTTMKESLTALTGNAATMMTPAQLSAVQAAASMGNNAEKLTPRVGTPAWDQALGQKVVWMVAGEQQSASLTLNPPDLGPLQVVLNVSNSQATATFTAAQPEVRQALEAAMPKLREMLGEAGIQLGQASVNSGSPNQQGAFEQQAGGSSRGLDQADSRDAANGPDAPRVSRVKPAASGQGLVDTFA